MSYADGSVGTLVYATQGGAKIEKEYLEVHASGQSAVLHNFTGVHLFGPGNRATKRSGYGGNKGQTIQMQRFIDMVEKGDAPPVPYGVLSDTTRLTLRAVEAVQSGQKLSVS